MWFAGTVTYQGGSVQPCQVEHRLVFMKLLNSGTRGKIIMEKVSFAFSVVFICMLKFVYAAVLIIHSLNITPIRHHTYTTPVLGVGLLVVTI